MSVKLKPSSATQWVACPGSVQLQAQFPPQEMSDAAREGVYAHKIIENLLTKQELHGAVDPDMMRHAENFIDLATNHDHEASGVEEAFEAPWGKGRVDYWSFDIETSTLHIWDYKYGHSPVEVVGNMQLVAYAAGVVRALLNDGWERLNYALHLYQPRCIHPDGIHRVWNLTAQEFADEFALLESAAAEALGPEPRTKSGPQCRYCNARHACPTARKAAAAAIDYIDTNPTPGKLEPEGMAYELEILQRAADAIKYRLTGIEEQVKAALASGKHVPGYTLQPGQGKTDWSIPPTAVLGLGVACGIDLAKPAEPITPNQAKGKGLREDIINAYTKRIDGKLVLVRDTGVRKAKEVFG